MFRGILLFVLLVFPSVAFGSVRITEIMYDAPGTDAGREWIELQNIGSGSLDPTTLFFFEADTNHKITHVRGPAQIASQSYAVLVDDVDAFLADFPSYAGPLFDSSWSSFSNEGETFELRDAEGVTLDRVSYANAAGATGDGSTLHGTNSSWKAGAPSPGSGAVVASPPPSNPPGSGSPPPAPSQSNVTSGASGSGSGSSAPSTPPHAPKVSAGGNRTVFAQVATEFAATLTGVSSEAQPFASYRWNFGNGEEVLKKALLYRYVRPGSYAVSVAVSTGGVTVSDRMVVTVIPTAVSILHVGSDGIELHNGASKDLDLTDWQLRFGHVLFTFPKDTTLLAGKSLFFESRVTKLATDDKSIVDVIYPTGEIAVSTRSQMVREPLEVVTQQADESSPTKASSQSAPAQKKKVAEVSKKKIVEDVVEKDIEEVVTARESVSTASTSVALKSSNAHVATIAAVSGAYETSSLWYAIIALVALLGLSSSAIFLMKAESTPLSSAIVPGEDAIVAVAQEVASEYVAPSALTVVARPKKELDGEKTNEADSYTIVE